MTYIEFAERFLPVPVGKRFLEEISPRIDITSDPEYRFPEYYIGRSICDMVGMVSPFPSYDYWYLLLNKIRDEYMENEILNGELIRFNRELTWSDYEIPR